MLSCWFVGCVYMRKALESTYVYIHCDQSVTSDCVVFNPSMGARRLIWKLLLHLLPPNRVETWGALLQKNRYHYHDLLEQYAKVRQRFNEWEGEGWRVKGEN